VEDTAKPGLNPPDKQFTRLALPHANADEDRVQVSLLNRRRSRRGIVVFLAALMIAVAALALSLSVETSQRFLAWKMVHHRAEAAAMAAALMLDGTPEGEARARTAALRTAEAQERELQLEIAPEGDAAFVRLASNRVGAVARARQAEVTPEEAGNNNGEKSVALAAPDAEAPGLGLIPGTVYTATGQAAAGRVVPVQVHTGGVRQLPLGWVAGRVLTTEGSRVRVEYLGGYLRGAQHGARRPVGWFEVALGGGQ
jgi:hypothetical protein